MWIYSMTVWTFFMIHMGSKILKITNQCIPKINLCIHILTGVFVKILNEKYGKLSLPATFLFVRKYNHTEPILKMCDPSNEMSDLHK